ncbi:DUF4430 domain-containing protein [bacterium]|jgi:hypothetical protein|nr:DUF4430 domain-containing protein [bacterium]
MPKITKILSYTLLILAALVVTILWQAKTASAPHFEDTANYDLNIEFIFDKQGSISLQYPYSVEKAENLLTVTENLAAQQGWEIDSEDYDDLGILITQIKDLKNGQNQKYWQYYINEAMPMVSVDNYFPQKNDNIKWIFDKSEF